MSYLLTFLGGMILVGIIWFLSWWRKDKDAVQELAELKAKNKVKETMNEIIKKPLPDNPESKLVRFRKLMDSRNK